MGAAQTTNHVGEHQEKKVFTVRLKSFDWEAGRNFVGDQFRIGMEPDHNLYSEDQNKKKQQEQVSRSDEQNFFRKKGEEQKNEKVFTVSCQGKHKPRKR